MWYIAVVMMAQPEGPSQRRYLCETCNVLLSATDADEAYGKAVAWGVKHEDDHVYGLKLLGISLLQEIGDEIGDGVDISGRFFQKLDVWKRRERIIPPPEELSAIRVARSMHMTLEEVLTPHQLQLMRIGAGNYSEPPP